MRSLTFALPSGTVIDTAHPDAEAQFAAQEPDLARGLAEIRDEIRADTELAERIRRKFEIKNTMGYRLIAFLEADTPLEIFRRLIVGSEGTLAFVSEVVFDTVPFGRHTATAFVLFPGIDEAVACVQPLVQAGASATELMMVLAMKAAQAFAPIPPEWNDAPNDAAAILVEFRSDDPDELAAREAEAMRIFDGRPLVQPAQFTRDPELTEVYWRVREGLHGLLGKIRPRGTSLIIEDVCVPPARIAEAAAEIRALLGQHGFLPGVAGHASAGNLHFMLTPAFGEQADRDRYEAFMADLVALIVDKYDGSLKAEHGTGLNMAPWVEREWGPKATEMMWRIKALADPHGVLAPGVLLNRDSGVHLRNLKTAPPIEEEADTCVECGFCEPVCPSRWLTTTPRQRIVLRREMARQPAGSPVLARAARRVRVRRRSRPAPRTARACSACPLGIDTGKLVKELRSARARPAGGARRAGRGAALGGGGARGARRAARGCSRCAARPALLRSVISNELVPEWPAEMPPPAPAQLPATDAAGRGGRLPAGVHQPDLRLAGRARPRAAGGAGRGLGARGAAGLDPAGRGRALLLHAVALEGLPRGRGVHGGQDARLTLGLVGRGAAARRDRCELVRARARGGRGATRRCAARAPRAMTILDSIAWAHDRLLPDLEFETGVGSGGCAPDVRGQASGPRGPARERWPRALADEVYTPPSATCCGFAGDRGFLHPELPAAATADEAAELAGRTFDAHLCSNRTCEIGLHQGTGRDYESFLFLLERATRPR